MKLLQSALLIIFLQCVPAVAETHSNAYVLVAPGVVTGAGLSDPVVELALGGEAVFAKTFGLGVEVGGFALDKRVDSVFGIASVAGYYHFSRSDSKFDPFVTGGYSAVIPSGSSLANFGAGVNRWFAPHLGVKFVFRDYLYSGDGQVNLASFGVGLLFH